MRYLRLISTAIAALILSATLLVAQAVQELKIVVAGDVPTPLTLSAADLAAMPREQADVTEQDGTKTVYEGVPLQEILKKAGIPFGRGMRGRPWPVMFLSRQRMGTKWCSV